MDYYLKNGIFKKGPFQIEELKNEKIYPKTLVWKTGLEHWVTASEVEEISPYVKHLPPPAIATPNIYLKKFSVLRCLVSLALALIVYIAPSTIGFEALLIKINYAEKLSQNHHDIQYMIWSDFAKFKILYLNQPIGGLDLTLENIDAKATIDNAINTFLLGDSLWISLITFIFLLFLSHLFLSELWEYIKKLYLSVFTTKR